MLRLDNGLDGNEANTASGSVAAYKGKSHKFYYGTGK